MAYVQVGCSPALGGAWMLKDISCRVLLTILSDCSWAAQAGRSLARTPVATIQQTATVRVPGRLYGAVTSRAVPANSVIQGFRIVDNLSIVNRTQSKLSPQDTTQRVNSHRFILILQDILRKRLHAYSCT